MWSVAWNVKSDPSDWVGGLGEENGALSVLTCTLAPITRQNIGILSSTVAPESPRGVCVKPARYWISSLGVDGSDFFLCLLLEVKSFVFFPLRCCTSLAAGARRTPLFACCHYFLNQHRPPRYRYGAIEKLKPFSAAAANRLTRERRPFVGV